MSDMNASLAALSDFDQDVLSVRYVRFGPGGRSREEVLQAIEMLLERAPVELTTADSDWDHLLYLELVSDGLAVDISDEDTWTRRYLISEDFLRLAQAPNGIGVALLQAVRAS